MALRREVMNYVGTGAIGGMIGYYVGAQGLLGIQSQKVVTSSSKDEEQPPENENQPSNDESRESNTSIATFEDGDLSGWQETETASITDSKSYEGDQSLVVVDQNGNYGDIGNYIYYEFDNGMVKPSRVVGAVFNGETTYYTARMFWGVEDAEANSQVNSVFTIGINNHEPLKLNGTPLVDSSRNQWYFVELEGIDWENKVISDILVNDTMVASDMSFSSDLSGISRVGVHVHAGGTGTEGYFDNLTIG